MPASVEPGSQSYLKSFDFKALWKAQHMVALLMGVLLKTMIVLDKIASLVME